MISLLNKIIDAGPAHIDKIIPKTRFIYNIFIENNHIIPYIVVQNIIYS